MPQTPICKGVEACYVKRLDVSLLLYSNLLYAISGLDDVQTLLRSAELYTIQVVDLSSGILQSLGLIDA